jgi:hypothetical protein
VGAIMIRPVEQDEWSIVAWLWQCFRHDLAPMVSALPYADGRYQTAGLPDRHTPDAATYLAWLPHPKTHEPAPVGFAVVDGLTLERRTLAALWTAPAARHGGVGTELALDVIGRHDGPWAITFQHDNPAAGRFWRRVADAAFGAGAWREDQREVAGVRGAPPDHWIES